MRDALRAGLRPHPLGPDAEALGDLVGGQQAIHDRRPVIVASVAGDGTGASCRVVLDQMTPVALMISR